MAASSFVFLLTVQFIVSNVLSSSICISGSTIQPTINGEYTYQSFDTTDNGPIYYNNASNRYLYPYNTVYMIHNDPNTANYYAYCNIPSTSDPKSPYDCYNGNGGQLYSYDGNTDVNDIVTLKSCTLSIIYQY